MVANIIRAKEFGYTAQLMKTTVESFFLQFGSI